MNRKLVFHITGRLLEVMALLLLLPMVVSILYREPTWGAFLVSALISFSVGVSLRLLTKEHSTTMYAKEGFLIVALAWVTASLVGSLPFIISGEIPNFFDAFFETVSGFTTTGSSIATDVESLSYGILFWRSFTHWIGGMGVLVFLIAFFTTISDRSIHVLKAEMPGPIVGKLVPRARDTSKVLYLIYLGITIVQIVLLVIGGMPLFDSILHTFGTVGTGGFGIKADSMGGYSAYSQWVVTIFMILCGINFNLFYLLLIKRFKAVWKSSELWTYLGIIVASALLITWNIASMYPTVGEALRHAFFQVSSLMTTTGYATTNFDLWPAFSKGILLVLMFIGGCAGSTAGGLKVSRVVILFRIVVKEFRRMLHPRAVTTVNFEGKELDDNTKSGVTTYFAVYMICFFLIFLVISLEPFSFETNFSAVVTCFNNVGPGFAGVGPMYSFAEYTNFSKFLLSIAMLMGRLEIYPLLIAMIPSTWKKHS